MNVAPEYHSRVKLERTSVNIHFTFIDLMKPPKPKKFEKVQQVTIQKARPQSSRRFEVGGWLILEVEGQAPTE